MIKKIYFSPQDAESLKSLAIDLEKLTDDYVDYSGMVVDKPWGYEYLAFQNDNVAVWVLHIKKDFQTSIHCHPNKKTSLAVLQGRVICSTLNDEMTLGVGEGLFLEKGVFHSTRAVSPEEAIVVETETPPNKKDLVRLGDKYGRKDKGYEGKHYYFRMGLGKYAHLEPFRAGSDTHRKIGECHFRILRGEESKNFLGDALNLENQVVCILSGAIANAEGKTHFECGDVFPLHDLNKGLINPTLESIELLIIEKANNETGGHHNG